MTMNYIKILNPTNKNQSVTINLQVTEVDSILHDLINQLVSVSIPSDTMGTCRGKSMEIRLYMHTRMDQFNHSFKSIG